MKTKKALGVTMSSTECNLGSLEPDKLFKDSEIKRFVQACSLAQREFAILRADGLQMYNEKMTAPEQDIEDLSYDGRIDCGRKIKEKVGEDYTNIVFYAFVGIDESPYVHILESSKISYQVVKRLSRIGGEKVASIGHTGGPQKSITLEEQDIRLLYKCRGSLEMELGKQVKETEVVRLLMVDYIKRKKIPI